MASGVEVALHDVSKYHGAGRQAVCALAGIDAELAAGELLSIVGPSGSGKSTLLNLIGGLDTPSGGRVIVEGRDLTQLSDDARSDLRLRRIGFVFQSFNLLPSFSAEDNVAWPLGFLGAGWRA